MGEETPRKEGGSPDRERLRRLEFHPVRGVSPAQRAVFTNDQGQTFEILASADRARRAALREFTKDVRGFFQAVPDDGTFAESMEATPLTKGGKRDDGRRGILVEMSLVRPRPEGGMICEFHIDPRITRAGSPHRYKPDGHAVSARIYVGTGRARLRMFSGSDPTQRLDEASAGGYAGPLDAQISQPRAHIRALSDVASYDFLGRWEQL